VLVLLEPATLLLEGRAVLLGGPSGIVLVAFGVFELRGQQSAHT
jgi:hypothetical protein